MRRVALLLAAALGLTLTPLSPAGTTPTASAAASDVIAVVVEGTGFGHGRGMSQWGAYGWAVDQSRTWQWILDHYYGGTTLGDVNTAQTRIKVRLLGLDGSATVGVTSGTGQVTVGGVTRRSLYAREISPNQFQLYGSNAMACPGGVALTVPDGTFARGSTNVTAVRQIQTFLNAYQAGTPLAVDGQFGALTEARLREWQTGRGIAVDGIWNTSPDATTARAQITASAGAASWSLVATVAGPVTFSTANSEVSSAAPSSVLGVCDASGRVTHYRGKIQVHNAQGNANWVVNDVKTEDYLRGVVPKEISASWADAGGGKGANAVRAQAVAARSYGLQQNRYPPYATICDSQSCQVYFGSATRATATGAATNVEDPRTNAAIVATAGKVRLKNGNIVATEFSASNGPRTAGGAFPPVDDAPGDGTARNPNHRWTRVLDAHALASTYGLGTLLSVSMAEPQSTVNQQFDGIWFNDVVLTGTTKTVRVPAWDFRGSHGLPSPGFTVRTVTRDTTNTTFGMIGDSVGNSVAGSITSELVTLTDGTFPSARFDMVDGRCTVNTTCPGTSGVEAVASLPMNLDLVVVQLGYNDWSPDMATAIDTMMNALTARGVRRVAWVNLAASAGIATNSATYAQRNAALQAATGRWSNLTILDWNGVSNTSEKSRWFASDGVHLSATGQARFAIWLRDQITTLAPVDPFRTKVTPNRALRFRVAGVGGVPTTATSVALNVTAVDPAGWGFLTVWPCGSPKPNASNVNFVSAGAVEPNSVLAKVDATGEVCVATSSSTHVLVDVAGWFSSGFESMVPKRVVDTRNAIGAPKAKIAPAAPLRVRVAGRHGVPAGATGRLAERDGGGSGGLGFPDGVAVWGRRSRMRRT